MTNSKKNMEVDKKNFKEQKMGPQEEPLEKDFKKDYYNQKVRQKNFQEVC